MGLYSEQISSRVTNDAEAFERAFGKLSSVVMGDGQLSRLVFNNDDYLLFSIEEIFVYFGMKRPETFKKGETLSEQMDSMLDPSGLMRREVELKGSWYKDGTGPLLARTKDGRAVALIPGRLSGYSFYDSGSGKRVKVTKRNCQEFSDFAFCFYKPLPQKKLGIMDLLLYIARAISPADYALTICITAILTLLGLIAPFANRLLFGRVIESGSVSQLLSIAVLMAGAAISTALISITDSMVSARMDTKVEITVKSAAMSRLLALPASFFKDFSSGEVSQRLASLESLCNTLVQVVLGTGISSLFSLVYLGQIASFTPALAVPAFAIILINISLTIANTFISMKTAKRQMEASAKLFGFQYSIIKGVQKIKLAGCELRALSKWAERYEKKARLTYAPPWIVRLGPHISGSVFLAGGIVLYAVAGVSGVSPADYMAFNVSYGLVSGAVTALAGIVVTLSAVKPTLDMASPLLRAEPENTPDKKTVKHISGSIEVNKVSFRYSEDMPLVLDDLSLKISPGQYVAVVGVSGCGKSTLMRLLLGFEKPNKGAVYYDGLDLSTLNLKSLRKNIGCVIQEGKLVSGSIFENIALAAPWISLSDAWNAAEAAGIADDIRDMPMGMHTVISEGGGSVSGGQRQRLLIARAIAPRPKILLLDEATSALDNITQKFVSDSLDSLKCTRLVIAHRMSTIRHCDRIILLENGKIAEDGTYEELLALNGSFAELVRRQLLED